MRGYTHALIGLTFYVSYLIISDQMRTLASALMALIFSLLPDIDTPYSTISRVTPMTQIVSEKINVALGHRGPLHSLFFRSVITVFLRFMYASYYISRLSYIAASLAYLSHLIADSFTPKGVPLFRPIDDRRITICKRRGIRKALCVRTGGYKEDILGVFILFTLMILVGIYMGLYP